MIQRITVDSGLDSEKVLDFSSFQEAVEMFERFVGKVDNVIHEEILDGDRFEVIQTWERGLGRWSRNSDHVDGYDRDDLGESPDF